MADLSDWLERQKKAVDALLEGYLPAQDEHPETISKAVRYSVFAGGKRLRPILVLESCRVCGGREDDALRAACAVECIHTYSLVHDDLPAMDDDDLRRGKPTTHKAFGEAVAILTGDALLTFAFEVLTVDGGAKSARLACELAGAAGARGMVGGQVLDIAKPPSSGKEDSVRSIHSMKTAALLRCACRMGAICAEATDEQLGALTNYGTNLGLAFQISDDILDETSTPEELGKATHKDLAAGKLTYPGVFGLEEASRQAREHVARAIEALEVFGPEADNLRSMAEYVARRKS